MTIEIGLLLGIVLVAVILLTFDWFSADVVAIGILLAIGLTGLLPPRELFAGFGSETVVMIFGLLVLTSALINTGVITQISRRLFRAVGNKPERVLPTTMAIVTAMSAFISNTATAALFLPITLEMSRRLHIPRSKLLMPMAFASILASSISLVASSTNVLVSGLMVEYGLPALGIFELTAVGLPIAIAGIGYMLVLGNRIIPVREEAETESKFEIHPYMAEMVILPGSSLAGRTLAEAALGQDLDLTVVRIVREGNRYIVPRPGLTLVEGDELLVKGQSSDILKIKDAKGVGLKAEVKLSDPRLQDGELQLVEVLLLPGSPVTGRSLKTLQFRQRYRLQVLGINRRGKDMFSKLSRARLQPGDQLLLQGTRGAISALNPDYFHILGEVEHRPVNQQRARLAIGIFAVTLLLAAFNILSLAVAVTLGVLVAFLTRCITPGEAYQRVAWHVLIVIGCMLALGVAMESTGTADFLATQIIRVVDALGAHGSAGTLTPYLPVALLTLFFIITMGLTQPMSNQAAAVLVFPIAIETAARLGLNPRAFAVMIAVSASCSFITPLEPACLIVYGPGHYKFLDFTRVGGILTVIIYLISILLIPLIWPLIP
jgi:di/tricarboxylate transporter